MTKQFVYKSLCHPQPNHVTFLPDTPSSYQNHPTHYCLTIFMEIPMRNISASLSLKRFIVSAAHFFKLSLFLAAILCIWGCNKDTPPSTPSSDKPFPIRFEASGEEFLISALDEVQNIADLGQQLGNASIPTKSHKAIISSTTVDTTYIY